MKVCFTCKKSKPTSEYWNQKRREDWLYPSCKDCAREQHKLWRRTKLGLAQDIYKRQKVNAKKRWNTPPNYSKEELADRLFSQPNFEKIYNNRVASWYEKNLWPSIDRVDDYVWYTLDNLQLVTRDQNNKRFYEDKKNWINTKNCKTVYQFSMMWELINKYYSCSQASRETWYSQWHISWCASGVRLQSNWFFWLYDKRELSKRMELYSLQYRAKYLV